MEKITVAQAAKLKDCSKSTILQLIRKNILPAERVGPIFLIPRYAVEAYQLPGPGRPRGRKNLPKNAETS
jgi:excisionase family DNA binding protein